MFDVLLYENNQILYGRYRLQKKVLSVPYYNVYYSVVVINVTLKYMCNWHIVNNSLTQ